MGPVTLKGCGGILNRRNEEWREGENEEVKGRRRGKKERMRRKSKLEDVGKLRMEG